MARNKLNKVRRFVVVEILHWVGAQSAGLYHELYRALYMHGPSALTEKEKAYLKKTMEDLKAVNDRARHLKDHLNKTVKNSPVGEL